MPLFIKMTFKETVKKLLDESLTEYSNLFLIDFKIDETNKIIVVLDGDNGVQLQDCINISRSIENNLDREAVDFGLEVASAGLSTPLKTVRQFKKNIGRTLIIKLQNKTIEAKLIEVNDQDITVTWSSREPKKIGKGKETIVNTKQFVYNEIVEAIVTVTF